MLHRRTSNNNRNNDNERTITVYTTIETRGDSRSIKELKEDEEEEEERFKSYHSWMLNVPNWGLRSLSARSMFYLTPVQHPSGALQTLPLLWGITLWRPVNALCITQSHADLFPKRRKVDKGWFNPHIFPCRKGSLLNKHHWEPLF